MRFNFLKKEIFVIAIFQLSVFLPLQLFSAGQATWSEKWKATTQLKSNELLKMINSKQWYERSAALITLSKNNKAEGQSAAKKLILDSALLVRAQAAQVLLNSESPADQELLKEQVFNQKNFYRGQSLFIRRQIIMGLPQEFIKKDTKFLNKLSQDSDHQIVKYAKLLANKKSTIIME